jgi:hypothetical protein
MSRRACGHGAGRRVIAPFLLENAGFGGGTVVAPWLGMRQPRFLFHIMLGSSIAVAATGIALGADARLGPGADAAAAWSHKASTRERRARFPVERLIPPPFPIAPRFGGSVAGTRALSWRLEPGTDGARVELCPTSDFDEATTRHIDVEGEQALLPAAWPAGVWYWRLRGRDGATVGDRATPTWMLYLRDGVSDGAGPS